MAAAAIAFVVTALVGVWLIPLLRKLKYGQTILDIGPNWHKNKQGIPTMGGIMFIIGISAAVFAGLILLISGTNSGYIPSFRDNMRIVLGLVMALAFGVVGFTDDYIKVVKKRNLGLSARQKLVVQTIISAVYLLGIYLVGDSSTIVYVPFFGQWDLGMFYYPLALLGISYMVNVVNITDGVDGLCSSVTFATAVGFIVMSGVLHSPGMGMFSAALAGGCIGFLVWNFHPAKAFMGDTGSMFLGGCVVAIAFGLGIPVYLIFLGFVYILEGLTVMIQTAYFKATRKLTGTPKRLFKMSPIHHHFEMSGWSEEKICVVFSITQAAACILAVLAAMQI